MPLSRTLRFTVIAAIPVLAVVCTALFEPHILEMAHMSFARLKYGIRLMMYPPVLLFWTVTLGVILHACLIWYRKQTALTVLYMLLALVLSSLLLLYFYLLFFFRMPGDGGIL